MDKVLDRRIHPYRDDLAAADCEVRGDEDAQAIDPRIGAASEEDWDTEYLDAIVAVKVVDGVDHLIASGLVDRDRVGITGGSYGGFATARGSSSPPRIKSGVRACST